MPYLEKTGPTVQLAGQAGYGRFMPTSPQHLGDRASEPHERASPRCLEAMAKTRTARRFRLPVHGKAPWSPQAGV